MKIVLSIKPEFAHKIFDGSKRFEFRRVIHKDPRVKTVVVYASAPISKLIGEFRIEQVHRSKLASLWRLTRAKAGITRKYFHTYFEGLEEGYAIEVGETRLYNRPVCLTKRYGLKPPQSFAYIPRVRIA